MFDFEFDVHGVLVTVEAHFVGDDGSCGCGVEIISVETAEGLNVSDWILAFGLWPSVLRAADAGFEDEQLQRRDDCLREECGEDYLTAWGVEYL